MCYYVGLLLLLFLSSRNENLIKLLPSGSKPICHDNVLLVLSCGDPPEIGAEPYFSLFSQELKKWSYNVHRQARLEVTKQPTKNLAQQSGDVLMEVFWPCVEGETVSQSVSRSSIHLVICPGWRLSLYLLSVHPVSRSSICSLCCSFSPAAQQVSRESSL